MPRELETIFEKPQISEQGGGPPPAEIPTPSSSLATCELHLQILPDHADHGHQP